MCSQALGIFLDPYLLCNDKGCQGPKQNVARPVGSCWEVTWYDLDASPAPPLRKRFSKAKVSSSWVVIPSLHITA